MSKLFEVKVYMGDTEVLTLHLLYSDYNAFKAFMDFNNPAMTVELGGSL